jgi:hypothetical protein
MSVLFVLALLGLAGCSGSGGSPAKSEESRVVPAGEKASVGHLTYNIVDSQILAQMGDEANPRVPHDRFIVVQVSVSNSSNVDNPIPAIELVADSGQVYNELSDGTGVINWLGIVRHVGPGQTERGEVAFDAPAAHYKLKFSDESADTEVLADLPLSYSHERINETVVAPTELPEVTAPTGTQKTK